jgi:hypothetical protein
MLTAASLSQGEAAINLRGTAITPQPMLDSAEPPADSFPGGARYVGRARTFTELLSAYRLVYRSYLERGYMKPNAEQLRMSFHNLLPDTATFVLSQRRLAATSAPGCEFANLAGDGDRRLVGTVSIAIDSEYGLPLGETFPERLRQLRIRGRRVAEAIMLAHRPDEAHRSASREFQQLLMLLRCVTDYARLCDVDDLCIQINPHHVTFYKRKLAFEVVDGPRPCPSVRGAPAVLLRHDMHTIRERSEALVPKASKFFLSGSPDPAILTNGYRLRVEDVLKLLSLKPELWRSVGRAHSGCDEFMRAYPDLAPEPHGSDSTVVSFHSMQDDGLPGEGRREAVA